MSAVAISDDGMFLAGNIADPMTGLEVAGRYSVATGMWESLGYLPNTNPNGCPSLSSAYDISGDGSLIGGFAQGNCRTAATWDPTNTMGGEFDASSCSEVNGISDTGSRVVGIFNSEAYYRDGAGPITTIGALVPGNNAQASDTNEAGTRIVGFDFFLLSQTAWVWSPTAGFENLYAALDAAGVPNLPAFGLSNTTGCSADGVTIVGNTQFGGGWIVEYPICDGGASTRCQTSPNSVDATGALISSSGSISIAANNLVLNSSPVPDQNGTHYFGPSLLNGDVGLPFGNGWRCVGPGPVFRRQLVARYAQLQ
jgi:uncharacterized membrane protein